MIYIVCVKYHGINLIKKIDHTFSVCSIFYNDYFYPNGNTGGLFESIMSAALNKSDKLFSFPMAF